MKRILLIIFPILSFSQVKVLSDIDFSKNEYKLVFTHERAYDTINQISHTFKDFVISDKKELIELQNNWIVTEETDELMECGYDYSIYVINKDSIIGTMYINISCGFVFASGIGKTCVFEGNPFKKLKVDKPIYRKCFSSNSIEEARKIHHKIIAKQGVYYPDKRFNDWIDYEGEAYISITLKNDTLKSHQDIINDFDEKFGKLNQYIDFRGFSKDNFSGWIYCNKTIFDDLILISNKSEWEDYDVNIKIDSWNSFTGQKIDFIVCVFSESNKKIQKIN
ncbi:MULTISPECIES: hypothetical protein [unclassified Flavobacterium]|uniref:hypothetical protein n=1 Tax=unclassified Flavobacterium TaxID=196869 RepID=UPI001291AA3D|nr:MULTISPECIES: hypothetical protein [unclassified Flavobacterium]MQP53515.1 hypothetical protein [Flavobacterium sp. LMO9]MQP63382.1 hypothetical protein [Flavobacterium sp. LMO6]